jgi:hypothetical protein
MGAVLAGLWTFLNSSAGQTIVISLVGLIFTKTVKSKDRREQILGIASRVFMAVEALGLEKKMNGEEKWLEFVKRIVDQMQKEGLGELSGKEMAMLKAMANNTALAKKVPPAPPKLPKAIAVDK